MKMNQSESASRAAVNPSSGPGTEKIQSLIQALGSKNNTACQSAYQSLLNIGEPAVKPLLEALDSPVEKVRWQAIKLLEELKIEWSIQATDRNIQSLIADLASKNGFERMRARRAVVKVGTRAVVPLLEILSGSRGVNRWEAAKALSQIGSPSATEALINALTDRNFDIRWLAAEGLISIGEPALVPLLHELIKNPQAEYLKEGVHHYLHEINNEKLNTVILPVIKALESPEMVLEVPLSAKNALNFLARQTIP